MGHGTGDGIAIHGGSDRRQSLVAEANTFRGQTSATTLTRKIRMTTSGMKNRMIANYDDDDDEEAMEQ